jgi:REP element-mobilizing transposase RayT
MARPLRIEFPGALYHVTARGNARQSIFRDDDDRRLLLGTLEAVVSRYGWLCHAYCLMDNHFHVVVETPRANLATGMRHLNGVYSQRFNQRWGRSGHLFEGRYQAILVEKDPHLLELARYVALNPQRAGICAAEEWRWSSYRATAGIDPAPCFLTVGWLLGQFSADRRAAQARYREFVHDGDDGSPLRDARGKAYLGSVPFVERHRPRGQLAAEIPRSQREPVRPSLQEIFGQAGDEAIALAYRHGYRLREIAEHVGVHYATVSRRLKRLESQAPARTEAK